MIRIFRAAAAGLLCFALELQPATGWAQGTAFTYQGQLSSGGALADGSFDVQFSLFLTNVTGSSVAGPVTTSAVAVSNGVFTTLVDFGDWPAVGPLWLELAVRTNGSGAFATLAPRQQITPTPEALFATAASNLLGAVTYQNLPGFQNANNFNALGGGSGNVFNTFYGWNTIAGGQNNQAGFMYSTVGGGFGNNAAGYLSTVGGGDLDSAFGQYSFVGGGEMNEVTADNAAVVGGYDNFVNGIGAFIGGGGTDGFHTYGNQASGPGSVIGGGVGNYAAASAADAVIGGGLGNTNGASYSTIGGGHQNTASGQWSTVSGGGANTASGNYATVLGGQLNQASGYASLAAGSFAWATNFGSFVWADGQVNPFASTSNNQFSVRAAGGVRLETAGAGLTVDDQPVLVNGKGISFQPNGGGGPNVLMGTPANSISGGVDGATISGGLANTASASDTTIGGGGNNTASAVNATVSGGGNNTASGSGAMVAGGIGNNAGGFASAIGGGYVNTASADYATVPGGRQNVASGTSSLAAGHLAQALHPGAFVWADSQAAVFASTTNDQFSVRAGGGVRLATSGAGLTVDGQPALINGQVITIQTNGGVGVATGGAGLMVDGQPVLTPSNRLGLNIQYHSYAAPNIIMGSYSNHVANGVIGATISGGGNTNALPYAFANAVTANYGTIGGGDANLSAGWGDTIGGGEINSVSGDDATVAGGSSNMATNLAATVGGGVGNVAGGNSATVAGGWGNIASGNSATIPGGFQNVASGRNSFAAGQNALASYDASFVWSDVSGIGETFSATTTNQFAVSAHGGVRFVTGGAGMTIDGVPVLTGTVGHLGDLTVTPAGDVGVDTAVPSQKLEVNGKYLMVDGANGEQACLGGYGNTVQVGSLKSGVTALACYNVTDNAYMHVYCSTITVEGGADLAEPFTMTPGREEIPQGAVVVIDAQNPGHLKLSDRGYDPRVAGVVSGANGIHPGIQMQQQGLLAGGKNVALTGRVYVQADASNGAISPGDLLTTSTAPGRAMKVTDHVRAAGAILGKAMTGLDQGQGMVLVLVTLQ